MGLSFLNESAHRCFHFVVLQTRVAAYKSTLQLWPSALSLYQRMPRRCSSASDAAVSGGLRSWTDSSGYTTLWHVTVFASGWEDWPLGFYIQWPVYPVHTLASSEWYKHVVNLSTKERCLGLLQGEWSARSPAWQLQELCENDVPHGWSSMSTRWSHLLQWWLKPVHAFGRVVPD